MNVKKLLLALSLCLVMVLGLFFFEQGLFSSLRQEDLYGTWLTDVPAAERVELSLIQFGISYDVPDDLLMTYEFTFKEDGTVTIRVEEESAKNIAAVQAEALRTTLPELLYAQYEAEANMSREETDAMLAAEGLTMETFIEMALTQVDFESQFTSESMIITQHFRVEKGLLGYAASSVDLEAGNYDMTVVPTIKGNTMVLSDALDRDGNPFEGSGAIRYPLTLTRE